MTDYPNNVFNERTARVGDFHSFWLPGTPKDGEFWFLTQKESGGMPINISHKRSPKGYTDGGNWLQYKYSVKRSGDKVTITTNTNQRAYHGSLMLTDWSDANHDLVLTQQQAFTDAYNWGADAILALRPDLPDFSSAMAIMELKDFVPDLKERTADLARRVRERLARKGLKPQRRPLVPSKDTKLKVFNNSRKAGAEWFLAVEMGWIPLFADIVKFSASYAGRTKKFEQILKDEGKPVRRRANLHKETNTWYEFGEDNYSIANPNTAPTFVSQCYPNLFGAGQPHRSDWKGEYTREVWCSGKSRYLLPPGPRNDRWTAEIQRRILGMSWITPSNAYNLIPWSWLADYFSGLGNFIEATDPAAISDSWYCDYAYIMDRRVLLDTHTSRTTVYSGPGLIIHPLSRRIRTETYQTRVAASIFGWGLSQDDLSPKQLGILGALGLSRL